MTTTRRPLRFYELINSGSNVNFMLDFESERLNKEDILRAFKLVQRRHPYYLMQIKAANNEGALEFVENPSADDNIKLDEFEITSKSELCDWQSRLIRLGSNSSNASCLVCLELYSFDKRFHQLFGSVNHAGIDGPGLFQTIRDFVSYLDSILSGENVTNIEPRRFLDIHESYGDAYDLNELKKEPIVKEIIEPVKPINTETTENAFIKANFYQLDERQTKNLVDECKKNGVTIQAALSTVIMLAHLNYTGATSSGTYVNSCPCNMRSYVKDVCKEDVVCGSAALIWDYDVDLDEELWRVVGKTGESIKTRLGSNYGFKWWIKLVNSIPTQPFSIMGSSMGVVSLDEDKLRNLKINDLRFLGSSYKLAPGIAGIMLHAFTFNGHFTMSFNYTYPSLPEKWARTFSNNIWTVLNLIADGKVNTSSLKSVMSHLEKHDKNY